MLIYGMLICYIWGLFSRILARNNNMTIYERFLGEKKKLPNLC